MRNSTFYLFLGLNLFQLIISFYSQTYLLTDDLYRLIIGSQMSDRQFDDYIMFIHKWQWINYLFIPLTMLLRICYTWLCLRVGSFVSEQYSQFSIFKICVQAEIIFSIGAIAGLLYTEFFVDIQSLEQLSINPFSLQFIFIHHLPKWSNYFFNTINLFELCYVLFLAFLISSESKKTFLQSLKFISYTYLIGLGLWVLLVTYLSVLLQPLN